MRSNTDAVLAVCLSLSSAALGCGRAASPVLPSEEVAATATPTPQPSATPAQSAACRLAAPTADCSARAYPAQELAGVLQEAIDVAAGTPGVMYPNIPNTIYDLEKFRSRVIDHLTASGVCGAWDYGNVIGDEIYLRSADGCKVEQYDVISGRGGPRNANKSSNLWSEGWGMPVPGPKPQFSKEGDLQCSLPGDRTTYCVSIRNTQGEFGASVYGLIQQVIQENPQLVDPLDYLPGQGGSVPDQLRLGAFRIANHDAYIGAVEKKLRSNGYCAYVENGDILKVKSVAKGNIFHEEYDIIQNPNDSSYTGFAVKDRCHDAGF